MKKTYLLMLCCIMAASLHAQEGFGTYLRDIIQRQEKGILGMAKVIEACGLCDSLDILMDYEYERRYQRGWISDGYHVDNFYAYAPEHRKYGYTLFAETDDFWLSQGIDPSTSDFPGKIMAWILSNKQYSDNDFTTGTDYASENNLLYRWATYHLLPYNLTPERLVYHVNEYGYDRATKQLSIPVTEYYVTMGKRRLLRIYESAESQGVYLNRFSTEDKGRQGSGHEIACAPDKKGIYINKENFMTCPNAIVYPISESLAYTETVADDLHHTRLRFDIAGIFPELSNNNIRTANLPDQYKYYIPPTRYYPYLADLTLNDDYSSMVYFAGCYSLDNLNGDEFYVSSNYDITLRLPPVPREGIYEIRYKMKQGNTRCITQVYFGTDKERLLPAGLPIDFRLTDSRQFGWQNDIADNDYVNQSVDNELHFHGVMKGAKSIAKDGSSTTERDITRCFRYILVRQKMSPNETYYLRLKDVQDIGSRSLYMDYIELCPENIYDNPELPEDIW